MPTKDEIKKFSDFILDLSKKKRMSVMDTILWHCQTTGFEVELAATLLTPNLKSKIGEEAENENLIKKVNKLPI